MKLKPKVIGTALGVGVVCLGLVFWARIATHSSQGLSFQLTTVMPRNFDVNVKTVGVLDAVRSHMVSSEVKGDKAKIIFLVKDGTRIATGDDLVKLDPTPFEDLVHRLKTEAHSLQSAADATEQMLEWEKNQVERELKAAQFDIEVANLEFDRLVKGDGPIQLAQLTAEAEKAREEWSRYDSYIKALEDLAKKGVKNPSEMGLAREKVAELKEKFESANRAFHSYRDHVLPSLIETARAKVERSRMELEQTRKGSVFKVAKAISNHQELKGKLQMAQSALQEAQGELGKTVIRAPFDGIAILYEAFRDGQQRKPRIGDLAWQNQPLLYLPDISSMIVKTQIREIDLYKIAVGQSCTVQVDAYPDQLFDGEISFIGALAEERLDVGGGEKYFQVTVLVKTEDTRLRPGMTARVTTLTDQIENALCVPIQTIFDEAGIKYCYRFSGEVFQKVKVLPGRQNENMVEIMSGLKEGEQVSLIKPPEEKIKTSLPSQ